MPADLRFLWDALILLALAVPNVLMGRQYVRLLASSTIRLRGGWRIASLLPLLVVIPALIGALLAWLQGYNVWLFVLFFFPAWLLLYQVVLLTLHRWFGNRTENGPA